MAKNVYDRRLDLLVAALRGSVDRRAELLRGGKQPPGTVAVPPQELLRLHLLFTRSFEELLPDEQEEARAVWQRMFAGRERGEVAEFSMAMERYKGEMMARQTARQQAPHEQAPYEQEDAEIASEVEGEEDL